NEYSCPPAGLNIAFTSASDACGAVGELLNGYFCIRSLNDAQSCFAAPFIAAASPLGGTGIGLFSSRSLAPLMPSASAGNGIVIWPTAWFAAVTSPFACPIAPASEDERAMVA